MKHRIVSNLPDCRLITSITNWPIWKNWHQHFWILHMLKDKSFKNNKYLDKYLLGIFAHLFVSVLWFYCDLCQTDLILVSCRCQYKIWNDEADVIRCSSVDNKRANSVGTLRNYYYYTSSNPFSRISFYFGPFFHLSWNYIDEYSTIAGWGYNLILFLKRLKQFLSLLLTWHDPTSFKSGCFVI